MIVTHWDDFLTVNHTSGNAELRYYMLQTILL